MGSLGRYHKLICWFLSDCCCFSRSWSHKVWYPELKTPRKEVFQTKKGACQKNGIQKRSPEKIMPNIYLFQLSNYFFWILPLFLLPSLNFFFTLGCWCLSNQQVRSGSGYPQTSAASARPKGQLLEAMMEMRQGAEASGKVGWGWANRSTIGPNGLEEIVFFFWGDDTFQ